MVRAIFYVLDATRQGPTVRQLTTNISQSIESKLETKKIKENVILYTFPFI